MKTFNYEMIIREHHLDTFGHVNNAIYLQLFEEARWEIITAGGFGLKQVQEKGLGPVILEVNVKFLRELRVREKIRIESASEAYERATTTMVQKIFNEKGEVAAEARFKFGLFDLKARRIVRPTSEWLNAIGNP